MNTWGWICEITRAVIERKTDRVNELAVALSEAEQAKEILRNKGYGEYGMSIASLARLVPDQK